MDRIQALVSFIYLPLILSYICLRLTCLLLDIMAMALTQQFLSFSSSYNFNILMSMVPVLIEKTKNSINHVIGSLLIKISVYSKGWSCEILHD